MILIQVLRALLLVIALHAFLALASGEISRLEGATLAVVIVIAAAVGFFDTRRRKEFTMLGNLGIPQAVPSLIWAGTAVMFELLIGRIGTM